uniref:Uncharacterized protein n=1 Tax=Mola mola TaxID=94237 RepID=A0A3Q3W1Z8_MOLML
MSSSSSRSRPSCAHTQTHFRAGLIAGNLSCLSIANVVLGQFPLLRKDSEIFHRVAERTPARPDPAPCLEEWCHTFL